jgi:hypothetical protein
MVRKARASFALLLLALFLGSGVAYAVPASGFVVPERTPGMLTALWEWVTSLAETRIPFLHMHEASVGIIPIPPPSGPSSDGGAFIDPSGEH